MPGHQRYGYVLIYSVQVKTETPSRNKQCNSKSAEFSKSGSIRQLLLDYVCEREIERERERESQKRGNFCKIMNFFSQVSHVENFCIIGNNDKLSSFVTTV